MKKGHHLAKENKKNSQTRPKEMKKATIWQKKMKKQPPRAETKEREGFSFEGSKKKV